MTEDWGIICWGGFINTDLFWFIRKDIKIFIICSACSGVTIQQESFTNCSKFVWCLQEVFVVFKLSSAHLVWHTSSYIIHPKHIQNFHFIISPTFCCNINAFLIDWSAGLEISKNSIEHEKPIQNPNAHKKHASYCPRYVNII